MTIAAKRSELLKWLIVVVLAASFLLIPEKGIYTHQFKLFMVITVFSLALAAFELVPDMFIAVTMPSLWIVLGVAPITTVMSSWISPTMLMLCGSFFLAATLEDCGLLQRIAYFLMCKVKGSYFLLLASILIAGIVISVLTAGQGYLVLAALATGLCLSLNAMKTRVGAGIALATMLGSCTAHAYTYQATAWGIILQIGSAGGYISPTAVTPLSITLHCWPMFLVSLFILFIVSKWYKPGDGLGEVSYFEERLAEMGKTTQKEKANIFVLVILMIYVFTTDLHHMEIAYGFALLPWLVYLPFINGADNNTLKRMNMPMLFFVASCMAIGTVANSFGMGEMIKNICESLLQGSNNPWMIMSLVFVIVFVLNFLMTPLAIFSLITEPMCMLAVNAGFSPIPFLYAINACSEAVILPYEYVPYLVVYAFGMMKSADFIKLNILRSVLFFTGFLLILLPYWKIIGLL